MELKEVDINSIRLNPKNPRIIKDDKFKKLCKSIKDFPEMMNIRPIVVDENMMVLGGNMRLKACKELKLDKVPICYVNELTEEQKNEFIIKDNNSFGEWDYKELGNWDKELLNDWGTDIKKINLLTAQLDILRFKFIIPPFSILDTTQGYWQERKKNWHTLIGDNGESRENTLGGGGSIKPLDEGVSILDPVLSEIINLWFSYDKCKVFDPFAGDSVFGYVSSFLGKSFTGIELRQEQADLNNDRIKEFKNSKYICDDGQNVLKHIEIKSQDLLFSCPPYFDLEKYSNLENDASNQKTYEDFLKIIDNTFTDSIKCLKDNRFAVITVGNIRDKKGRYIRFVDDIKDIFIKNGMYLYNEMILIEPIGNLRLRVTKQMETRKIGKRHQNTLVFYKGNPDNILVFYNGDPKEIKKIYPNINESSNV
jgi:DNA modification methylase